MLDEKVVLQQKNARLESEKQTGKSIVSSKNAKEIKEKKITETSLLIDKQRNANTQ